MLCFLPWGHLRGHERLLWFRGCPWIRGAGSRECPCLVYSLIPGQAPRVSAIGLDRHVGAHRMLVGNQHLYVSAAQIIEDAGSGFQRQFGSIVLL